MAELHSPFRNRKTVITKKTLGHTRISHAADGSVLVVPRRRRRRRRLVLVRQERGAREGQGRQREGGLGRRHWTRRRRKGRGGDFSHCTTSFQSSYEPISFVSKQRKKRFFYFAAFKIGKAVADVAARYCRLGGV